VGTLDTKGPEYAFVRERLREAGAAVTVVDVGVLGEPGFPPDVTAAEVARAAGAELADLRFAREGSDTRAVALATMERGAIAVVGELRAQGRCDGAMGLGGSGGSTVVSGVLRSLPVGVPKLLVSTMASGNVRTFVGTSDICLMYPVTDVAGLNRVSRRVLGNAASAMAGMVRGQVAAARDEAPLVAITMFGITTPGVLRVQAALEARGFETIVFHAVGSGGRHASYATATESTAEGFPARSQARALWRKSLEISDPTGQRSTTLPDQGCSSRSPGSMPM